MRRGGTAVAVLLLLTACGSSSDDAQVTTTTVAPTTTTTAAPSTTTTAKKAAKATTTSTRPQPASTVPTSDGEEEVEVVVEPEHIEPYLLRPDTSIWRPVRDDVFGTGPMGLEQAAADETEDGGSRDEARKFLEELGFHSGYSRVWEKPRTPNDVSNKATHLFAYLYFFGSPQGARAYLDHDAESFEEATGAEAEEVSAGIRGSRAWAGVDENNQSIAVVLFTVENFYARIVCTSTHDPSGVCRSHATEHADQQHRQLQ